MTRIDVRKQFNDDVGYVFDDTGDYICKFGGCIKIFSDDDDSDGSTVPLCADNKESIINFIKAVKMAAGITETLGL